MFDDNSEQKKALRSIAKGRKRTNLLRFWEQNLIAWFVQRMPAWVTSNGLTAIGFIGNVIVAVGFVLAAYVHPFWLLINIIGFMISWFGDSLDGRLAYFRNIPRKWFGFCLDVIVDWLGIVLIGLGFCIYSAGFWKVLGFVFIVLYGGEMIVSQLRYKVSDEYSIDSGLLGPTEVRIILSAIFSIEVFVHGLLNYLGLAACIILFLSFVVETRKLLLLADARDIRERAEKVEQHSSQS